CITLDLRQVVEERTLQHLRHGLRPSLRREAGEERGVLLYEARRNRHRQICEPRLPNRADDDQRRSGGTVLELSGTGEALDDENGPLYGVGDLRQVLREVLL